MLNVKEFDKMKEFAAHLLSTTTLTVKEISKKSGISESTVNRVKDNLALKSSKEEVKPLKESKKTDLKIVEHVSSNEKTENPNPFVKFISEINLTKEGATLKVNKVNKINIMRNIFCEHNGNIKSSEAKKIANERAKEAGLKAFTNASLNGRYRRAKKEYNVLYK